MTELELEEKRREITRDAHTCVEVMRELRANGDRAKADAVFALVVIATGMAGHPLLDLFLEEKLEHVPERRTG